MTKECSRDHHFKLNFNANLFGVSVCRWHLLFDDSQVPRPETERSSTTLGLGTWDLGVVERRR